MADLLWAMWVGVDVLCWWEKDSTYTRVQHFFKVESFRSDDKFWFCSMIHVPDSYEFPSDDLNEPLEDSLALFV